MPPTFSLPQPLLSDAVAPHLPIAATIDPNLPDDAPELEKLLLERLSRLQKTLQIKGALDDRGRHLVIDDGRSRLQLYRASGSVRWYDHQLVAREQLPPNTSLPSDQDAVGAAEKWLRANGLQMDGARVALVARDLVAITDPKPGGKGIETSTEVAVCYGFTAFDLPVFGAGAKVRVQVVEGGVVGSANWFWRPPVAQLDHLAGVTVAQVIREVTLLPRYLRLGAKAKVTVARPVLGLYAAPPFAVQRVLIPCHAIDVTEEFENGVRKQGRLYLPALDLDGTRKARLPPPEELAKLLTPTR